jgi:hypothetical protein
MQKYEIPIPLVLQTLYEFTILLEKFLREQKDYTTNEFELIKNSAKIRLHNSVPCSCAIAGFNVGIAFLSSHNPETSSTVMIPKNIVNIIANPINSNIGKGNNRILLICMYVYMYRYIIVRFTVKFMITW